jgi:hypothetical protein
MPGKWDSFVKQEMLYIWNIQPRVSGVEYNLRGTLDCQNYVSQTIL